MAAPIQRRVRPRGLPPPPQAGTRRLAGAVALLARAPPVRRATRPPGSAAPRLTVPRAGVRRAVRHPSDPPASCRVACRAVPAPAPLPSQPPGVSARRSARPPERPQVAAVPASHARRPGPPYPPSVSRAPCVSQRAAEGTPRDHLPEGRGGRMQPTRPWMREVRGVRGRATRPGGAPGEPGGNARRMARSLRRWSRLASAAWWRCLRTRAETRRQPRSHVPDIMAEENVR